MRLFILSFVTIFAALFSFLFLVIYEDSVVMERQHCVKTEEKRQSMYIQNIYGAKGQIISSYPVYHDEYKYTCDDVDRWR